MNQLRCYNCHLLGHKSKNCPEEPQNSRCPSCDKVDFHTPTCKNTSFVSVPRHESTSVFKLQNLLKIDFQKVDNNIYVDDNGRENAIERAPLWLSAVDAFVGRVGERSIEFAISRPLKRHVTIINTQKVPVLSLVFFENVLRLNNRFSMDKFGQISLNTGASNEISEQVVCRIGIHESQDMFKVRIHWHGHKHVFEVIPTVGPIFVDPLRPNLMQPATTVAMDNANTQQPYEEIQPCSSQQIPKVRNDRDFTEFTVRINVSDVNRTGFNLERQFVDFIRNTMRSRAIEEKDERDEKNRQ